MRVFDKAGCYACGNGHNLGMVRSIVPSCWNV